MANGKKLAKPRPRVGGGQAAGRASRGRAKPARTPVARVAAPPASAPAEPLPMPVEEPMPPVSEAAASEPPAPVDPVASSSPDPAPDAIIRLGAQLTIREAVPLRVELLERVDAVEPVGFDASAVQKVDTAGLQVLLAFISQRRKSGGALKWMGCSEAVRKAAALLALEQPLGLPATGG